MEGVANVGVLEGVATVSSTSFHSEVKFSPLGRISPARLVHGHDHL